jgi:hypothetical protein
LIEPGRHAIAEIQHQPDRDRRLFRREIGYRLGGFLFENLEVLPLEAHDKASARIRDSHIEQ